MKGLGDVICINCRLVVEVGQGSCDPQDTVVGAPGERQPLHGPFQEGIPGGICLSHLADQL